MQGIHKMILECLVGSESKDVLKKQNDEDVSKGHRNKLKEPPKCKAGIILATK